ncbi:Dynein heavy chain family protein [Trichomonas vaginalis G3]|uniref:Dynein heavy chain family protein n=1 Tax=Trichomonas vaginalis (strain ATCC PRA-98 / G3) TaxID=412133 RepID=A2DC21_TRIV3|nr:dynein heavy chain family protein family [Trichomonas vaginalis G3]EAY22062.1 Dynein heavy chain family protein [Trichomonas vaginalis G3]KAI5525309.1 dynein heavy chain family protein family [Trichomonas vaginalis G3]|eukprot:XP_001583048.1 Dynein heavy chain family protein [Trichomonas vaginalis G3]
MSNLSSTDLISFMKPTIKSVLGISSVDDEELNCFSDVVQEFIEDPNKLFLIIRKTNKIVIQNTLEYTDGPILVYQKYPITLTKENFEGVISVISLPTQKAVQFLQLLISQFFVPYMKNTIPATDKNAQSVLETISTFDIAISRYQQQNNLPEPIFDINSPLIQSASSGKLTKAQEIELLSIIDRWENSIKSIISYAKSPPTYERLHDEFSFWTLLGQRLKQGVEQATYISKSNISTLISNQQKLFNQFFREAQDELFKYNQIFGPYSEGISSFDKIITDIDECNTIEELKLHIPKLYSLLSFFFQKSNYPQRSPIIYKLIKSYLFDKLIMIISVMALQHLPLEAFKASMNIINDLCKKWISDEKELIIFLNEKRTQCDFISNDTVDKSILFKRFNELENAKIEYHLLSNHFLEYSKLPFDSVKSALDQAFELIVNAPFLDFTQSANKKWDVSIQEYKSHLERIDSDLVLIITKLLQENTSLVDTQQIFVNHKNICRRPAVLPSLKELQHRFEQQIEDQLVKFEKQQLEQIDNLPILEIVMNHGTSDVFAKYLHVQNISQRLNTIDKMISDVISEKWQENYPSLREKYNSCRDKVKKQLGFQKISDLVQDIKKDRDMAIFEVTSNGLVCTIDEETAHLISIFRSLQEKNITPDTDLIHDAPQVYKIYKNAIRIQEGLNMFNSAIKDMDKNLLLICASDINNIYSLIRDGYNYKWTDLITKDFSKDFNHNCYNFSVFYKRAKECVTTIENTLQDLEDGSCLDTTITEKIKLIQQKVYEIDRKFNHQYIKDINERLLGIIASKVDDIVGIWVESLKNGKLLEGTDPIKITVTLKGSHISINPSPNNLRSYVTKVFTEHINNYLLQQTITLGDEDPIYFRDIDDSFPVPYDKIEELYKLFGESCEMAKFYLSDWQNIESIFLARPGTIEFSNDIFEWMSLINSFSNIKKKIEISSGEEEISCFVIDTNRMKSITISKLNEWIKYSSAKLYLLAGEKIYLINNEMSDLRVMISQKIPTTARGLSNFLKSFKEASDKQINWESYLPTFEEATKFTKLEHFKKLKENVNEFKLLLENRRQEIENNKLNFRKSVQLENESIISRIDNLKDRWNNEKPLNGDILPDKALQILENYMSVFDRMKSDWQEISSAMELLGLETTESTTLQMMIEERQNMVDGWILLKKINEKLETVLQQKFQEISIQTLKQQVNQIIEELNQMSNIIRQYEGWIYFNKKCKNLLKIFPVIEGLKSEAIQQRHWKHISTQFSFDINFDTFTVKDLINFDLLNNESFFSDVLRNAQGEYSLNKYLDQLSDTWNTMEFEFSSYKDKISLIKSGNIILSLVSDHLNFLSAMQTSPFFHVFREKATEWENSLNRLQVVLDDWLNVQRRFIYLEGVFSSLDIRQILVKQTNNFRKQEKEFMTISKRLTQLKIVMKITLIPNIGQILNSLNENLILLQKELSEYLEKQRSLFPRFFFIGDEDLLEIIGKSSSISEIQKHFGKMFEGLSKVEQNEENMITKFGCSEGEIISVSNPLSISKTVHQTLSSLEKEMKVSLNKILNSAIIEFEQFWQNMTLENLKSILSKYPSQIVLLCFFVTTTNQIELGITKKLLSNSTNEIVKFISLLSQIVFSDLSLIMRHSVQQLITESVHQRNITKDLQNVDQISNFEWTKHLRYYLNKSTGELTVSVGDAVFNYGYEYLGLCQSLVRTPLTDKVYLTMAQALFAKLGGSPFGPAGTGKTETVKNMGHHLGRLVLVFNCDETFDFKAMGRIFVGLCHCGSWGCFDEFNRLDEQMLSAVSQQIQTIQNGLKMNTNQISILGRKVPLNKDIGIFITMNPGYAGRVELPDNLKQLFRSIAMNKPDTDLITEVLLFSQGFETAEKLAPKFVLLFGMAKESLSNQTHYDFGLRAMKSVLANAGQLIRQSQNNKNEEKILISSIVNALFPKLLSNDLIKLKRLMDDIFPGITPSEITQEDLLNHIKEEANNCGWTDSEIWVQKIIQLYYIQQINHGFMLVGASSSGKTSSWKILLKVLTKIDKIESEFYVINPKSVTKDTLFGCLDPVSREWTDGVFTRILRQIVANQKNEMSKRHWIVFDGDVDPEWVENLNSVLDDNKLLTLPNGERIALPSNVRIVFEVENLNFATPATVSRCGIVYFSENTLQPNEIINYYLHKLSTESIITQNHLLFNEYIDFSIPDMIQKQNSFLEFVKPLITKLVPILIDFMNKSKENAVMNIPIASYISTMFSLISSSFISAFNMEEPQIFIEKSTIFAGFWAFSSPISYKQRENLSLLIKKEFPKLCPDGSLLNYVISSDVEDWINVDIPQNNQNEDSKFIPISETVITKKLIQMMITGGQTPILCGMNGVGKGSLVKQSLSKYSEINLINLDFSSCSTIDFVLQTLEQFTVYKKTSNGMKLIPKQNNNYLVFVINNLNLPNLDKYGTQRVIEFLRQFLDMKGFWHPNKREWISLELIDFVCLCSPPTCYGRVKLNSRFLRLCSVVNIEHPSSESINKITKQLLEKSDENLVNSIVEFYFTFRDQFKGNENVHYQANMRDLIEWINSFKIAMNDDQTNDNCHVLFYEGQRIFCDRIKEKENKKFAIDKLQEIIIKNNENCDLNKFQETSIYTRILNGKYSISDIQTLQTKLEQKLKDFNEENSNEKIVFFDEIIEFICKVERRLSENSGHLLLVGLSGTGKTLIPNFVSFILNYDFVRLHVYKGYGLSDFDNDLRKILKSCIQKPVVFHVKENDLILSQMTEKLNVLMQESNIPGLFVGDEFTSLLTAIKDQARIDGINNLESDESLLNYFHEKVKENLKIIFTLNSATANLNETEKLFPSLFLFTNIIYIDTLSDESLKSYAKQILKEEEIDEKIDQIMVEFHKTAENVSNSLQISNFVSPRYFFDFVSHFCQILKSKKSKLQTQQLHLYNGLSKLETTQNEVERMGKDLAVKQKQLKEKEQLAEQKLTEIVKDKQITTQKKDEAQKVKAEIENKRNIMKVEQQKAQKELDEVQPIIEDAKSSVSNISKQKLDEIRRLASPPEVIKNILTAVLMLLGMNASNWTLIKKEISGDSFIRTILDFQLEKVTPSIGKKIEHFLTVNGLDYDKAMRASQACGPLFKWLSANIRYVSILESTEPLRQKVESLDKEAQILEQKYKELETTTNRLETRLNNLTNEYKNLVSECEKTRIEAEQIKVKMQRATNLISSLTNEMKRWNESRVSFTREFECLVGHSLLSSAFITYCGYLEQSRRNDLILSWKSILTNNVIKCQNDFNFMNFATDPSQLIDWASKGLPKDDLCIQNAIILDNLKRIPFIIDPTGEAVKFLEKIYPNLVKSSFIDSKFPKNLESCLRFGSPLLIEEGEQLDPLVYPVLSKEFKKLSGRTILDLKHNDIDVSPSFSMFIVTKDTDFRPNPSLCSMTVLVNFSVTSLSLRAQCLTRLLSFKLPDIEKQRQELHTSLSKMQIALHGLEEKMLSVFSSTSGEILENDELLHLLEHIKEEAKEMEKKAEETKTALQKINDVSQQFQSVAEVSTSLFFALNNMSSVHFLYQFSLNFFWSVFDKSSSADAKPEELIEMITKDLFVAASYSLLSKHLPILAFRFGQILIEHKNISVDESLYDLALRGTTLRGNSDFLKLTDTQEFKDWLQNDSPEINVPKEILEKITKSDNKITSSLKILAIMRKCRPDRIISSTKCFIRSCFGYDILDIPSLDIVKTASTLDPHIPMLLCASAGHDPSERVEECSSKQIESVAVGSQDSQENIESVVRQAGQRGQWIIIKNVHLAPIWTRDFVKSLNTMKLHPEFRLFLTSEINPKVGSNVFRSSRVIVFESATGIRANLKKVYSSGLTIPNVTSEKRKVISSFIWLHSVIMERLRYLPLGWSKKYEFNESDLKFALQIAVRWMENASAGRSHLSDETIPWTALRSLISSCVYGGRVDQTCDSRVLSAMANEILKPNSKVADGLLEIPDFSTMNEFKSWVDSLNDNNETPEMLWLPKNSAKFLFIQQGNEILKQILGVSAGEFNSNHVEEKKLSFVKLLLKKWIDDFSQIKVDEKTTKSNSLISNVINEERKQILNTMKLIIEESNLIIKRLEENDQLTQNDNLIISDLAKGKIPKQWNKHNYEGRDLEEWKEDFINRIIHLTFNDNKSLKLGYFSHPEAVLAAARQTAASKNSWPIEKVTMTIEVNNSEKKNEYDLVVEDITTMNAEWDKEKKCFVSTENVMGSLPISKISFSNSSQVEGVVVSCFMTTSRKGSVFEVTMPVDQEKDLNWWTIRAPALVLQKNAI